MIWRQQKARDRAFRGSARALHLALCGWMLAASAWVGVGCGAAPGVRACKPGMCAEGERCIVGACRPEGTLAASTTSSRLVAEPADYAVLSSGGFFETNQPPFVPLGKADGGPWVVLLRFDLDIPPERKLQSAFLLLTTVEGAAPSAAPVPIDAAPILGPWTSTDASWGRQPPQGAPFEAALAAGSARLVRVDVTSILEAAPDHDAGYGIALSASDDDPYGTSISTGALYGPAPRLEVYLQ